MPHRHRHPASRTRPADHEAGPVTHALDDPLVRRAKAAEAGVRAPPTDPEVGGSGRPISKPQIALDALPTGYFTGCVDFALVAVFDKPVVRHGRPRRTALS